jgi:CBS domain-containing membrane protein
MGASDASVWIMTETLHRPLWEDDGILADRVRSTIGPLLKRLDQPRVHIMATQGAVTLHGDVSDVQAKSVIESSVRRVPGVTGVTSHLQVGLQPGESTPSAGHRAERSPLLRALERVVRESGYLSSAEARYILRGLLSVFTARLPEPQRHRFLQHLPGDVRRLATSAHWLTSDIRTVTTEHDLAQTAAVAMLTDRMHADQLLRRVLPVLREHAPTDADTIAAALPSELRSVWSGEAASSRSTEAQHPGVGERPRRTPNLLRLPVSAVMTRDVVQASSSASLFEAFELMARAHVHHLPVVRPDGRCIALLDAVSVAQRLPEAWVTRGGVSLYQLGAVGPLSVLPDVPLAHAAASMDAAGVDACCVVDERGHLVGLLTARDVIAVVARAADHD